MDSYKDFSFGDLCDNLGYIAVAMHLNYWKDKMKAMEATEYWQHALNKMTRSFKANLKNAEFMCYGKKYKITFKLKVQEVQ